MPNPKLAGRPVSITISSPSVNITDIHSASLIDDSEMANHLTGDSRYSRVLRGEEVVGFEVETSDMTVLSTLKKGTICTTAVLTIDGATLSDGTDHTANNVTRTLSSCVQEGGLAPSFSGSSGEAARYTLRFIARRAADGTNPTVTDSVFAS